LISGVEVVLMGSSVEFVARRSRIVDGSHEG
jgi:hypothetical protein